MTRTITLAGFAVLVLGALLLERSARRRGRPARLGTVLGALTARPAVRMLVLAGWLWLGWHFFVRVAR